MDETMHRDICNLVGSKMSYSLRREHLSPAEQKLAAFEDEAVAAVLKFKRHHELYACIFPEKKPKR